MIFESNRDGNFDLFQQYIDERMPESIVATPLTKMLPQLAPDDHTVLYDMRPDDTKPWINRLMRVPVQGGTPEEVPIPGALDEFRCALHPGKRCVPRTTARGKYYTYYDLDPIRGAGRELARTKWIPGILGDWDISPDGTHVALPNSFTGRRSLENLSTFSPFVNPKFTNFVNTAGPVRLGERRACECLSGCPERRRAMSVLHLRCAAMLWPRLQHANAEAPSDLAEWTARDVCAVVAENSSRVLTVNQASQAVRAKLGHHRPIETERSVPFSHKLHPKRPHFCCWPQPGTSPFAARSLRMSARCCPHHRSEIFRLQKFRNRSR